MQVLDFLNLAKSMKKRSFPFNFTNISTGRHFTVTDPNILKLLPDTPFDTTFQNNVLVSLQLFPFACHYVVRSYVQSNKIASSTVRSFHNSSPISVCQNI